MARELFVVLGMHRGGTSLAAKALQVLGVELGERLLGPSEAENAKGFWEDEEIVDFNNRLLEELGLAWHSLMVPDGQWWSEAPIDDYKWEAERIVADRLQRYGRWGFKDPRTARLLPLWKEAFRGAGAEVSYLVCLRHPASVAQSLRRRNGFHPVMSHVLWLEHMLGAILGSEGARRAFVDYDRLVDAPAAQLRSIAAALGLGITPQTEDRITEFAADFVSGELRHFRTEARVAPALDSLPAQARRVHEALSLLAQGDTPAPGAMDDALRAAALALENWAPLRLCIDGVYSELVTTKQAMQAKIDVLHGQLARLGEEHSHAQAVVRERDAQLAGANADLARIGQEHSHAQAVVRERDTQLAEAHAQIARLEEARLQLRQRLDRIEGHWLWRAARRIMR